MAEGSVQELIQRCEDARLTMSRHNRNRKLLQDCIEGLIDLAHQLHEAKKCQPKQGERFGLNVSDFPTPNPLQTK
jgi:hypothetical protein